MRLTAFRQLTQPSPYLGPSEATPAATGTEPPARLVRCECVDCGAHCNAIAGRDILASCRNCGSPRLVPVEGARVILDA